MGQVRKPAIYQYWSKRKIIRTDIFCQTMPYSRFVNISRFLRFSSKDNSSTEPLNKIHEILDMILNKFNSCYTPNKKISIDESLLKFTGRFKYTHYIPNKSAVRGIKIYKLCESESGYCSNFHIHTTKIERDEENGELVGEAIIFKLAAKYLNKGYIIYMDNWFTSPNVILKLLDFKTYGVGTAKPNRLNFPQMLTKYEVIKGDVLYFSANNILALRFSDRKEVYFLTSYTKQMEMISIDKPHKQACRPMCIDDYNKNMGGVDKHDQKLASFSILRRSLKWYRKLFIYLFDMMLLNSSIIFYKYIKLKKTDSKQDQFTKFRMNLAEQILSDVRLPDYKSRIVGQADNPLRFENKKCILEYIPKTAKKLNPTLRCKYCSLLKVRRETVYRCKNCMVALHKKCFAKYHNKYNKIDSNIVVMK